MRRYLRAFGPASAADVDAWSGVTRLAGARQGRWTTCVQHEDEDGKALFDVPDGAIADEDVARPACACSAPTTTSGSPTPPATGSPTPDKRGSWMGVNGGVAMTVFVDGWLEGLWRMEDGRVEPSYDAPQAHQGRAVRPRRRARPRDRALRPLTRQKLADGSAPAGGPGEQGGDGGDAGGRRAQHLGAQPHGRRRRRRRTRRPPRRSARPRGRPRRRSRPEAGTASAASGAVASSCSTTARSALADQRDDVGGRGQLGDLGNHDRRACLAASRAVDRQRASDFAARSPFQTATLRAAAHGTISATPISVSTSTASSPRSPFGIAWTTTTAGLGRGSRRHRVHASTANTRLPVDATSPRDRRPEAVGEHDLLPDPQPAYGDGVVRLVARRRSPTTPTATPSERRARGGPGSGHQCVVERVAEPAEHRLVAGPHLAGRLLLAADRRQLAEQLLLPRVEPGRGLDDDGDDQVAATAAQAGHAATAQHLLGAGLGAGPDLELEARSRRPEPAARPRRRPRASAASAWCRARQRSSAA